MFKEMRRKDRAMGTDETRALLEKGLFGTLATVGEQGWPSATPLSYVLLGDKICFHCARTGLKTDNLRHSPKVCFTVVGDNTPVYDGSFTTTFESVMAYGQAREVTDETQKKELLTALCQKYLPADMDKLPGELSSLPVTAVWVIEIEHLTGKRRALQGG